MPRDSAEALPSSSVYARRRQRREGATSEMSKPGIAAVLSFFVPGLGQIYNGDFFRGFLWFVFAVILGFSLSPLTMGVASLVYHLWSAWSAYRRAETRATPPSVSF